MKTLRLITTLLLAFCCLPALAVNYVFPGTLPPGCSGGGSSYTCPGGGGLAYNDTVTIASPTPVTITVTGNISTNNARINESGNASNLTLIVNGTLTADYQAVINANVQATTINGSGSEVVFGGDVAAVGAITLGYRTRVNGNISGTSLTGGGEVTFGGSVTTTTGAMSIGNASTVAGGLGSGSGAISLAGTVQVAGGVTCTCALTLAHQTRVTGNVSAASVTATSQAYLLGSVTTTGAVDLAYATTLGGAVTAGGSLRLNGNTQAPQCLRSTSSSTITLAWADRANGGVCCGAPGSCTSTCVVNNSGAAMPALCSGAAPARFNAFDTTTAAAAITGVIRTKVSGTAYAVALVAVNTAGTGVATTFTGNVRVEVLDASNNSGALNTGTNCRASWVVAAGTSASTVSFAAGDLGRKNVTLTVAEAFRDARIRVSYPDTGTATVVGCSTDNFAIRPASFGSYSLTDATSSTAGTTRLLDNTALTTGRVHKAGRPFTVRATAVNSAGATTANYTGSPGALATACTGGACGGMLGVPTFSATAVAGVINTSSASYPEVGAFNLQLVDTTFAAVDAGDGSTTTERYITSATWTAGRFIPDHFIVVTGLLPPLVPQLRTFNSSTCTTRSFTYLGQPFGYALLPTATVQAVNAIGNPTLNHPATRYNAAINPAFTVAQAYAAGASAPALITSNTNAPTITPGTFGSAVLSTLASDTLAFVRPATAPVSPFSANTAATGISLTWGASDNSETLTGTAGNESIDTPAPLVWSPMAFDSGSEFRYGLLKLGSAYGSELLPLPVVVETQHWNGTSFVTNTADQCTSLPTSSLALGNFRGGLAACETAPTGASVSVVSGRALLRLQAPGNTNAGSVDATLQLGPTLNPPAAQRCSAVGTPATLAVPAGMTWLQSRVPGGTAYDQNPSARFSFGQFRSPLIQQREVY